MSKTPILGMTSGQLDQAFQELGEPKYRAGQVFEWLYKRGAGDFSEMSNLGKGLRQALSERYAFFTPDFEVFESSDGTRKYRFTLADGSEIESVWIPDGKRKTLCISSQVGCALKCAFCVTGAVGFKRNLSIDEIVSQVHHIRVREGLQLTNVVYMGMGEPLLNIDNVLASIDILTDPAGFGMGKRKITVSTVGLVPKIPEFFQKSGVKLAISLTGASDSSRDHWMPINQKYNLKLLMETLRDLPMGKGQRITFEVVVMKGENDTEEEAKRLARLLEGLQAKVNLIPYNENPVFPDLKRPCDEKVERFQNILAERKIQATVRKNRGQDVMAACGQLAAGQINSMKQAEVKSK